MHGSARVRGLISAGSRGAASILRIGLGMTEFLRTLLSEPVVLAIWVGLDLACVLFLFWDLARHNPQTMPIMRLVWALTVLSSGPIGLAIYFFSGRRQIARDSIWRRGFRSVSHCYSGCGIGEITGLIIAAGLLSLGNWAVAGITFGLAYLAGFALTMKPLLDDGESWTTALKDAVYSESLSIGVMEIVAIGVDLWLARGAHFGETLFWTSMLVSLAAGLVAAYPVNLLLLHFGVKEGMHDPRKMAREHAAA